MNIKCIKLALCKIHALKNWLCPNIMGFPGSSVVKNPPANAGFDPGSGRSPGGGNGNSLQFLAWEIPGTEKPAGSMWLRRSPR